MTIGAHCSGSEKCNLKALARKTTDSLALNNGQESTSTGDLRSPFLLVAPAWNSVSGALTPDRSQIDWSNGTYWVRCPSVPRSSTANLDGKWITQGESCLIRQQGKRLQMGDTKDCMATGQVDENGHITLDVSGIRFKGAVAADGNHINWQDGTYSTRAEVYGIQKEQEK